MFSDLATADGEARAYQKILDDGKSKKRCPLCESNMNADVMTVFEKNVGLLRCTLSPRTDPVCKAQAGIQKGSAASKKTTQEELEEWEIELNRVRELGKLATTRDQLTKVDIPELQKQLEEKEEKLPEATAKANEVRDVCIFATFMY